MKRTFIESAAMIGLACALFCAGFATARIMAIPPHAVGDMATWVSAIGTLLAFGGTLWIATEQIRFRNSIRDQSASITAAAIAPLIQLAIHAVENGLKSINAVDAEQFVSSGSAGRCADNFADLQFWDKSMLIDLAHLPSRCAINLTISQNSIRNCERMLRLLSRKNRRTTVSNADIIEIQRRRLQLVQHYLYRSSDECRKAAGRTVFD